jgi:DNA repair exonuclease SbcCD ATPase subunit
MQPEEISNINNVWAFMAFAIATVGVPTVAFLSKHWVAKSQELEEAKTKNRKYERDKQLSEIKNDVQYLSSYKDRIFRLLDEMQKRMDTEKERNNAQDMHIQIHEKKLDAFSSTIEDIKENTTDIKIELKELTVVMNYIKEKMK